MKGTRIRTYASYVMSSIVVERRGGGRHAYSCRGVTHFHEFFIHVRYHSLHHLVLALQHRYICSTGTFVAIIIILSLSSSL